MVSRRVRNGRMVHLWLVYVLVGALDGSRIHVIDTNPHSVSAAGGLDDVSKIDKYVMPVGVSWRDGARVR